MTTGFGSLIMVLSSSYRPTTCRYIGSSRFINKARFFAPTSTSMSRMGFEIFITVLERYNKRNAIYRSFTETGHLLATTTTTISSFLAFFFFLFFFFGTSAPYSVYGLPDLPSPTVSVPCCHFPEFLNSDVLSSCFLLVFWNWPSSNLLIHIFID